MTFSKINYLLLNIFFFKLLVTTRFYSPVIILYDNIFIFFSKNLHR